jgi:O-antigen/teichoic acid export membrane protein
MSKMVYMRAVETGIDTSPDGRKLADGDSIPASSSTHRAKVDGSHSIWRRVRRDVVLLGAGSMGAVFAQLVFRSILVAVLVPAAYGRLSLVLSIYNTVWIIGASGLPNGVSRYIAAIAPADDSAIVRSAFRAGAWPTVIAAALIATASGIILNSPLAFLYGAVGLSCLVYAVIIMGILRGRGRIGAATSIMPISGAGEVVPLLILLAAGLGVTPLSAFGVFCLGNVIGLVAGIFLLMRLAYPQASHREGPSGNGPPRGNTPPRGNALITVPSTRQLLGFSMWLGATTVGIVVLPLVVRFAAVLSSYTVVATVDVSLLLLSIPLRMGSVIVSAVVPHAARALNKGHTSITISRREHLLVIGPFVLLAIIVGYTPVVGWLFDSIGRPEYAKSAVYLALALLAGPARVLYGLAEGVLVAHGEGRFLALNSLSTTAVASIAIIAVAASGSMVVAFALFVVACWSVYVCALMRIRHLTAAHEPVVVQT